jgi:acetyl-CoA C-acetyltransferase
MPVPTAIIGVGQTRYRFQTPEMTWPELAQDAARRALADARLTIEDIDAVVLGLAPSALVGVNEAEKWVVDATGGAGRPFLRINTGGATGGSAAQAGWYHVASGMFRKVLVVAADKVAESPDAQQVLNTPWDPLYEKDFALNAVNMCSFQAIRHMRKYGTTARHLASVAVRSRANGVRNPYAHLRKAITMEDALAARNICYPLKLSDCCPRSSGGCALVMASADVAKNICPRPAWVRGASACTNTHYMGDRMGPRLELDYADWDELGIAARRAYDSAGITDPRREISVAEIYAPFTATEVAAVEALGFCEKGRGGFLSAEGAWDMNGGLPVNPSGGTLCANPISATALVRVADAALQVMGKAGDTQVPKARFAVATGIGGSLQFHTCMVLGDDI